MSTNECVVGEVYEEPQREHKSLNAAHKEHRERGFQPYKGPKLEGNRFKLRIDDSKFPEALKRIPRPPETIYGIGCPEALQEGMAIVGARKATPYGRDSARRFGLAAARKGIVIISGGARGCDSAAHRAALEAGTPTVVILGGGCDCVYPAENYDLFQRVIDAGGAVISEHEWDFPPLPYTFRERNRLIAGLARATLVVEAGLPSGTFSTADEALAASKEVLAVPGAITSKTSHGTNTLILQGAMPVIDDESFDDALFGIYGCLKQEIIRASELVNDVEGEEGDDDDNPPDLRQLVMQAVGARPTSLDELCRLAPHDDSEEKAAFAQIAEVLEGLMREGLVVRLPDGRISACMRGLSS